jgi:norsolorinic acid ketoreductase
MSHKVILITGANRGKFSRPLNGNSRLRKTGIGRALTTVYVSRDNTTIIAAVRDINKETAKSLTTVPTGRNSKVLLVKIDSLSEDDPKNAMEIVRRKFFIDHVDIVIANAGDSKFAPVDKVSVEMMKYHYNVNTIGPLLLFQSVWPLLQQAAKPKFIVISSTLGSLVQGPGYKLQSGAYGSSKAAINYLLKLLHRDHPNLIAMPVCPG